MGQQNYAQAIIKGRCQCCHWGCNLKHVLRLSSRDVTGELASSWYNSPTKYNHVTIFFLRVWGPRQWVSLSVTFDRPGGFQNCVTFSIKKS